MRGAKRFGVRQSSAALGGCAGWATGFGGTNRTDETDGTNRKTGSKCRAHEPGRRSLFVILSLRRISRGRTGVISSSNVSVLTASEATPLASRTPMVQWRCLAFREILRKLRMTAIGGACSLVRLACKLVGNGKSPLPLWEEVQGGQRALEGLIGQMGQMRQMGRIGKPAGKAAHTNRSGAPYLSS